jgi:predicted nucleotidyltransferase
VKETLTSRTGKSELTQALRTALGDDLDAVVLFGSRARGDAGADSDWDVLVIADGLPDNPFHRRMLLKQRLPSEWRGALALVIYAPDEFSRHVSSLLLSIAEDGAILYDRDGLAAQRLGYLRKELRSSGVVRERTAAGEVWRGMPVQVWDGLFAEAGAEP